MENVLSFKIKKVVYEEVDESSMFLPCKFYLISEGSNRNKSSFTLESLNKAIPKIKNKPILASYNKAHINSDGECGDFEEHNSKLEIDDKGMPFFDYTDSTAEKPIGLFPESSAISIEKLGTKNFLVANGLIWIEYNKRIVDLLKKRQRNKVSVEIYVKDADKDKYGNTVIKDFDFLGVTLLGKDFTEGIENAHLQVDYLNSDEFLNFKKKFSLALNSDKPDKLEIGTKPSLIINDEILSETPFGNVDVTLLKKDCLQADNYKAIVPQVFMKLDKGWEDGNLDAMNFAVMEKKDNFLVYNRLALYYAFNFAKENGDEDLLGKVDAIYKKLGMNKPIEKEKILKMKQFEKILEKYYFVSEIEGAYLLFSDDSKLFSHPLLEDGETFSEDKIEQVSMFVEKDEEKVDMVSLFTDSLLDAYTFKQDFEKTEEEKLNMASEIKNLREELGSNAEDVEKFKKLELDYSELSEKYNALTVELQVEKKNKFRVEIEGALEDDELEEEEKECLRTDFESDKFATFADFEKELAYLKYKKSLVAKRKKEETFQYSLKPVVVETGGSDGIEKAKRLVDNKYK